MGQFSWKKKKTHLACEPRYVGSSQSRPRAERIMGSITRSGYVQVKLKNDTSVDQVLFVIAEEKFTIQSKSGVSASLSGGYGEIIAISLKGNKSTETAREALETSYIPICAGEESTLPMSTKRMTYLTVVTNYLATGEPCKVHFENRPIQASWISNFSFVDKHHRAVSRLIHRSPFKLYVLEDNEDDEISLVESKSVGLSKCTIS